MSFVYFSFSGGLVVFVAVVFLSFSGAGETQTSLWGLGFPLCPFILDAYFDFNSQALLRTYLNVTAPLLFFFLFLAARVVRFLVVVGFFLFGWCFCLHCMQDV